LLLLTLTCLPRLHLAQCRHVRWQQVLPAAAAAAAAAVIGVLVEE
jgi:hypothetical protein